MCALRIEHLSSRLKTHGRIHSKVVVRFAVAAQVFILSLVYKGFKLLWIVKGVINKLEDLHGIPLYSPQKLV